MLGKFLVAERVENRDVGNGMTQIENRVQQGDQDGRIFGAAVDFLKSKINERFDSERHDSEPVVATTEGKREAQRRAL